jgi:hypothetical protein
MLVVILILNRLLFPWFNVKSKEDQQDGHFSGNFVDCSGIMACQRLPSSDLIG